MKKLLCRIFGHKFYVYAKPTESCAEGIRWLRCYRCGFDYVINDKLRILLPMDFEIQDTHTWKKSREQICH